MSKDLSKEESPQLVFNPGRVVIFRRLAGSEFQTAGATKLNEHSPKYFKLLSGVFKSFTIEDGRLREV